MASEAGGPEHYRRVRAHPAAEAAALVERALGRRVLRLEKDAVGASHAV